MTSVESFISYVMTVSVTYIFASQGMTLAGNSGVFVIFNEGVMLAGASATFLVAHFTGSIVYGVVAGASIGLLFGLIMAFFSVTLRQDQFVIGIGLYILGAGFATLLYDVFIGVSFSPPQAPTLKPLDIPYLSSLPFVGQILFNQNAFFYFAIFATILIWFFLSKTRYGLIVRSVGESPRVADSLGISVVLTRYVMIAIGGALIALAGSYVPLAFTGTYTTTLISGRGWISILIALFGRFRPLSVLLGALFFAGVETGALYSQVLGINAPTQVILMIPFIVALFLMIQAYRTADLPKGLGKPYDRESLED
ncbi:MAG: ABC transporter permease [Thaumarchaeota archaeon]|nr:ABC transporter permease [Nitrososphaerota archaeon]